MNRYRWALALAVLGVAAIAGLVVVLQPPPAGSFGDPGSGSGGSGTLIAVADRQPAPEFTGITGWINSPPLRLAGRTSGATLIDFWTYSCVNCTRTLPHLAALRSAYAGRGFEIVGVHSPEFDFEKDPANVRAAVQRLGVTWPVALDPDMATWNAWGNQYWPAEYLVDSSGLVAYVHLGEGDYDALTAAVRQLTGNPAETPVPVAGALPATGVSPELYAGGAAAAQHQTPLGDGEQLAPGGAVTDLPASAAPATQRDAIEVSGSWRDLGDRLESTAPGHVRLRFHAGDVYVVAGSSGAPPAVGVTLDGAAVAPAQSGPSLSGGRVAVARSDLYHLLTGVATGDHVLDLAVPAGFQLYTFTFG